MAGNNNDKNKTRVLPHPSNYAQVPEAPIEMLWSKTSQSLPDWPDRAEDRVGFITGKFIGHRTTASGLNARETVERPIKDAFGCQPPHIPYRPNMLLFYRAGMPVEDAPGANIEIIDRDKVISQHRGMTEGRMGPRQWDEVRILHNLLHNLTMNVSWIPIEQVSAYLRRVTCDILCLHMPPPARKSTISLGRQSSHGQQDHKQRLLRESGIPG
ncbi:unnamed protein product [Clonostachys rosea f. rosea IK726]|uniref:Uncharacterized protein n=2 Tax=Clonostachys rosea f. rosea IK726 TaxID=1349383 RepID=A0ACA9UHY6_BIOOC|nr:unnamed protein product [Clonostachys rosea f. rosea IK726]CAG9952896.1 unnamed protein product [Clonostachys rosea f. rosea IK726]